MTIPAGLTRQSQFRGDTDNILAVRLYDTGGNVISTGTAPAAGTVVDANNTTTTILTAGQTFTGTLTDISAYNQVNIELFARPSVIQGDAQTASASLFFEFSPDGTHWDISVPVLVRDPGLFIPIPLINVGRFFRARYVNDGGASAIATLGLTDVVGTPRNQTQFRFTTQLLPQATKELGRTLDQGISGSDPVNLTRSVTMGKTPAGQYTNLPAGGTIPNSPATSPLVANATYTSAWFPCLGWAALSVLVDADQISAVNGVDIQFGADGATVHNHNLFSVRASHVAQGSFFEALAPRGEYFRVVYTNGATDQTRFFLNLVLNQTAFQIDQPLIAIPADGNLGGQAGVSGTVNIPAGAVVTGIAAQSGATAGSVTIPGISGSITVPGSNQAQTQFHMEPPAGTLIGPLAITFSSTAAYAVEWVL